MNRTILTVLVLLLLLPGCGELKLKPDTDVVYDIRIPTEYEPEDEYPLLVALHDNEQDESQFLRLWDQGWFDRPDFLLLTLRGPFEASIGYSWFQQPGEEPDRRRLVGSANTSAARIADVIDLFEEEYLVDPDRVFLLGTGQSADIAIYTGFKYPEYFQGIGAFSPELDTVLFDLGDLEDAAYLELFLAVQHGEEDKLAREFAQMLAPYEMEVGIFNHAAGVPLTPATCLEAQTFFGLTATEDNEADWLPEEEDTSEEYYEEGDEYYDE